MAAATSLWLGARQLSAQPPAEQFLVPPQVVQHVDAVYPRELIAQRADGTVVLFVTVGIEGTVEEVTIAQSAGKPFDEAALVAARQWRFAPARRGTTPVRARIRVPFHFSAPLDVSQPAVTPSVPPSTAPVETRLPSPAAPSGGLPSGKPPAELVETSDIAGGVTSRHADVHAAHHWEEHGGGAPAATDHPPSDKAQSLTQVVVVGRSRPPNRGAGDYRIDVGGLHAVPRKSATEMLRLAPGILLTNEGGEGHADQVFLRGFDAREGQDIEFSVGGMPVNEAGNLHGNGHSDLHFIIPELVTSLRVLEGPFDPRQGNFAVAGSADYELGLDRRGLTAKYSLGSYGTKRLLLLWGPNQAGRGTFGGAEIFETDGFGQNRDARRGSAMAQYEGRLSDRSSFRLFGQAYATSYHSAGVIRDDDYRSGRKGFFDTYDFRQGGDASRYSVAGDVETKWGEAALRQQVFLIAHDLRMRKNYTGFLLDVQEPTQNPHPQRGDGIDLAVDSWTIGGRGSSSLKQQALGQPQELEVGYFARGDFGSGTQLRVQASNGVPYRRDADLDYRLGDIGVFGDANLRPLSWLTVRGGVRADLFTYNVLDNCAAQTVRQPSRTNPPGDASCLTQQDFGRYRDPTQRSSTATTALLPRASVLLGPVDQFTFSFSYGQGVRSIDPVYISQDVRTPFARVQAYEGGVVYAGGVGPVQLVARSMFFQTSVERDLIFSETAGRNTLANGTTRVGWAGSARAVGSWFDQSANVTLVRATFDDTHLLIPYVPDMVVRSDSGVHAELPIRWMGFPARGSAGLGLTYVGRRPLPYSQRSDAIFTVDAAGTLEWSAFELGVSVTNLLDNRYRLGEYNYASDFQTEPQPTLVPVRHFTAGPPRMILFTFGATLGGGG